MSYFVCAFRTALLQKLRSPKTWLPVLLLPLLVWACIVLLPQQERTAPVQVGVAYPESGATAFRTLLEERSGTVVTLIPTDADTIRGMVATGQWDCGLILPEDFEEKLSELDFNNLVTLCIGEASTVYPVVRESVSACIAELAAPQMAREYMLDSGLYRDETAELAEELLARVLTEEDRILISVETGSGRELAAPELADRTWNTALRGLVAIVVLIWQLFAAVDLGRWLESPAAKRLLPLRSAAAILLPRAAASLLPCLVSSAAALMILPGGGETILPLICYLLALMALAVLAARIRTVWTALPMLMPMLPVICLLLSPVLIDIGAYVPALAPLQACIPVTMFLRACGGSLLHMGCLILIAAVALLLAAADVRKGRGRR